MTPDNFNSVFDIKFHKPMGFSSNPAYYYKVKFTKGEDDSDKYARKIIVPYHSYMGISTQEAIARTLDNFAKDVVMIGNPREDSYETIQKYSNKANSKTLAQIIYENLDPQLPNGKVKYASMADIANFIELNSKQECFTAKKVDTFVKAFNAFKSKIEKETPDSFDCLVIPMVKV